MSQETVVEGVKLTIRRTFAAPVEKVYQAWTDPAKVSKWFFPNERWNTPTIDIDPRPGGRHNITMNHSDGDTFHNFGKYVDVVPNERLSFTWTWQESPTGPEETFVTVEFRTVSGGTELTLIHDRQTDPTSREQTALGWTGCFNMLETYLTGN